MKAKTRFFGEVDIPQEKVITMETGMIGFPALKHFALIFNEEKGIDKSNIMWLQNLDDGDIAFPVMIPTKLKPDYAPNVSEEIIAPLGTLTPENTYILVTVTAPAKKEDISINLKAPVIINTENNKGVQRIVEDNYPVKFRIYDLLQAGKEKAGE